MKSLTDKQLEIFNFILKWQMKNGFPPTQAEICDHFKFGSLNAVRSHLVLIEKKGYIRLNCGKARGIQLISTPESSIQENGLIPILGRIAAGVPIWAEQNIDYYLPINPTLFGGGDLFALRVYGDSMTGVGIQNGDIAIIKKQDSVENGEIAAILIDQEATLKRVYHSSKLLQLKSENPLYEDLNYTEEMSKLIRVLGRYQGIIRNINKRYIS